MKLPFTAVLLMASSLAVAAPEPTAGIKMQMLNKISEPGVDDRLSFQEINGERCRYHGKVVQPATKGHGLSVAINRKRCCPDNTLQMIHFVVPLPVGPIDGSTVLTGYPVETQQNGAGS